MLEIHIYFTTTEHARDTHLFRNNRTCYRYTFILQQQNMLEIHIYFVQQQNMLEIHIYFTTTEHARDTHLFHNNRTCYRYTFISQQQSVLEVRTPIMMYTNNSSIFSFCVKLFIFTLTVTYNYVPSSGEFLLVQIFAKMLLIFIFASARIIIDHAN